MEILNNLYILRPDGAIVPEPNLLAWAQWFEQAENRCIRHDEIGGASLSTVFLGIDHGFHGGPPVLFECMLFTDDEHVMIGRSVTPTEAIEMHEHALAKCRATFAQAADVAQLIAAFRHRGAP